MSNQESAQSNKTAEQTSKVDKQTHEKQQKIPVFYDLEDYSLREKVNSVFLKAQIVSIQEKEQKSLNGNQKTLIVSLKQILQERKQTLNAQIKVHPPNPIFMKNLEEIKKQERYNFFLQAKQKLESGQIVLIEILNGTFKKEKQNKQNQQPTSATNETKQATQQATNQALKKSIIIQLNEWAHVKYCGTYFENSNKKMNDTTLIKDITANNKYVNVLCVVTDIKPLKQINKDSPLLAEEFQQEKPEDQPLHYNITLRDQTGEIQSILPNIEKFKSFIQNGKLLFFQKAQIQHSIIKEGESNIFLNIYINEKKQKPKGLIWDCSILPEFKNGYIEEIKNNPNLTKVSQKVWIVKVPQTQQTAK
ncbi:hypothetical protein ABPG72_012534 [Tetrahymena utriculariae]